MSDNENTPQTNEEVPDENTGPGEKEQAPLTVTQPTSPTPPTPTPSAEHAEKKPTATPPTDTPTTVEPSVFANAAYACDRQYAIVLAQLMAPKDREKVYSWIERLDTMNDCDEMRTERDMYLKFLTLSLSTRRLVPPFTKIPQPGLRQLSTIVPNSVYNLIFRDKYATGECRPPKDDGDRTFSPPDQVEPSLFFSRQPMPRDGGIVYAAAFSTKKS